MDALIEIFILVMLFSALFGVHKQDDDRYWDEGYSDDWDYDGRDW